jgi:hypothetical protein
MCVEGDAASHQGWRSLMPGRVRARLRWQCGEGRGEEDGQEEGTERSGSCEDGGIDG